MQIIEIFANRRSGHHFFMSWLVSNITGVKDNKIKDLNRITWINDKICHYNDATYHAFFDYDKVSKEISNIIDKKPDYLFINYEESDITNLINNKGGILSNYKTKKIVFLRDFLNTFASKWKVSKTDLREFYFGFENEKEILQNVEHWKIMAKNYLNHNYIGFKYEDLLSDELKRNEFLKENFGLKEKFKPSEFDGTKSSFNTNNFNERYKEIEFNQKFKSIVKKDKELNSLINKLEYSKFFDDSFIINKIELKDDNNRKNFIVHFTSNINQSNITVKIREKFFSQGWVVLYHNMEINKGVRYWVSNNIDDYGLKFRLCEDIVIEFIDNEGQVIFEKIINIGRDTFKYRSMGRDITYNNKWIIGDSNTSHHFNMFDYNDDNFFINNSVIIPINLPAISINRFLNRNYLSFINSLPIMDNDEIIFNLGEIDCRVGFIRNAKRKNITVEKQIENIVKRYINMINELRTNIDKEINYKIMLPNPAIKDGWVTSKENIDLYLENTNEKERFYVREYFEKKITEETKKESIEVLNTLDIFKGDDGFMDTKFLIENDTHVLKTDKVLKSLK